MKTFNGLAAASVKTINSLAIASVKTVNGLALEAAPAGDGLELTFTNLSTNEFSGFTTVSDWNTFFNLPTNGTAFTSVSVNGNTVNLLGGGGITLDSSLFSDNYYPPKYYYLSDLISIVDNDGVIEVAGQNCFMGCHTLTSVDLPALITTQLLCFYGCTSLTTVNLPALTTVGYGTFWDCTSLTTIDIPLCTTVDDYSFNSCTALTTINISSCTYLGGTTGETHVFENISSNTISITVPTALMTCNGGNPDGDIAYLQANNTVTVTQV